jgi:protein TonB
MKILLSSKWNETIFENRNQNYGAFELRENYSHNQSKALFISVGSFCLFILFYWFYLLLQQSVFKQVNDVVRLENDEQKTTSKGHLEEIEPEILEIELPSIHFKIMEDKKLEKLLSDKRLKEMSEKYEIFEGGIIKYSVDPKTGIQYKPQSNAEFPGGAKEFTKHLLNNIEFYQTTENKNYHYTNGDDEIDYEINTLVFVKCEIDEKGTLINVELVKGASDPKFNERILEAFRKSPKWLAASHKGAKIKETLIIPFHFYYMQPLIKYYP